MAFIYPGGDEQQTLNLGLATWGMDEVLAQNMSLIDAAAVHINGSLIPNLNFVNSASVTFSVVGSNVSATAAGGGGTPGGTTGDIQYNNAGTFGGSAATITAAGSITVPSGQQFITPSLEAGSVFIDATTGIQYKNLFASTPVLPAGTYIVHIAVGDGNGNYSNAVIWNFTSDGAHTYAIQYDPPASWWSNGS